MPESPSWDGGCMWMVWTSASFGFIKSDSHTYRQMERHTGNAYAHAVKTQPQWSGQLIQSNLM